MKLAKLPPPLLGLLSGAVLWSCAVGFAWVIYPIPTEGWEAAGFVLLFLGMPSSMLLHFYSGPVIMQVLLMSLFGYLQWPTFGLLIGTVIWLRKRRTRKAASR
jgi:hypothetical protein